MLAKAGTSRQGQQDHVHKRLEEFVGYFVKAFETKLHLYHMVLEGEIKKAGKLSDKFSDTVGQGVGAAIILAISSYVPPAASLIRSGASLGGKISNALGNKFGAEYNEKKAARLSKLVYFICDNQSSARKILVEAGFNIFQSFEMQFTGVTSKQGVYQQALRYLATDAVNRAISYLMEKEESSIIEKDVISKGVILGESKIEPVFGIPLYSSKLKTAGLKVKYKYGSYKDKRTTADLYEKVGLTIEEGEIRSFYEKKDGKSRVDKYGYRRLLMSESWEDLKQEYKKSDTAVRFTDYQYILSLNDLRKQSENILSKIDLYDNDLSEERIKDRIKELKDELLNFINIFIGSNNEEREILKEIQADLDKLQVEKVFKEIKHLLIGVKERVEQGIQISKQGFQKIEGQLGEISLAVTSQKKNIENGEIRFDVRGPVSPFIGRIEQLDNLHKVMMNDRRAIVSQSVSISGLGGVGKSELAREYIRRHSQDYDNNVIWINAESYSTLEKSFCRLACDKLGISLKDRDGEKRDIKHIVEDVYRFFSKGKSLFIFDNAEKFKGDDGIYEFLPSLPENMNKPHTLVTSRNKKWPQNVKLFPLGVFTEEEAIEFIKKSLGNEQIENEEDVIRLAETLQYFPLALQQAVAYIKVKNEELKNVGSEFRIDDYLKRYEEKTEELLNFKFPEDSDNIYTKTTLITWKVTLDSIRQRENGDKAIELLNIMAYFAPENIPTEVFFSFINSREELGAAIQLLKQYSMVDSGQEQTLLNIHGLVQQVIRINLKEQNKEEEVLKKALQLFQDRLTRDEKEEMLQLSNEVQ